MVFIRPAAAPATPAPTLRIAMLCNGAKVMPSPKPATTRPMVSCALLK
jgi:hypothetical protein